MQLIDPVVVLAFVPAVVAVVVAPGPDSVYTVTQSLSRGPTAGVVAGLGTATGVLVHTAAAVVGLSALLRTTAEAYLILQYAGAVYLAYLGIRLLWRNEQFAARSDAGSDSDSDSDGSSLFDAYRRALVINVSNPQVAVFVLAFFPQFVPPSANATLQLSVLGLVYAGLSFLYLGVIALVAGRVRQRLVGSPVIRRAVRYASGSVLIGVGVTLALEQRPR